MTLKIAEYFLLFMMYSFLGWCMETTLISIQNKRFIDRGFLLGPYCPIYGFGSLLIVLGLGQFSFNPVVLFIMTILLCSSLEYATSWIMEKLFKARWWDYSDRKFNLNGRVCLFNAFAFGILGLLVNYVLNPWFLSILEPLSEFTLKLTATIIGIVYLVDCVISFNVIFGFRKVTRTINSERKQDNTEQITQMVRKLFAEKSFFHRRFINAYPRLEAIKIKMKEFTEKVSNEVNEAKEVVNQKREEIKKNIEQGTDQAKIKLKKGKKYIKTSFTEKKDKKGEE